MMSRNQTPGTLPVDQRILTDELRPWFLDGTSSQAAQKAARNMDRPTPRETGLVQVGRLS